MAGFSSDGAIGHGGSPPLPCFFRGTDSNQTCHTPEKSVPPMNTATPGMRAYQPCASHRSTGAFRAISATTGFSDPEGNGLEIYRAIAAETARTDKKICLNFMGLYISRLQAFPQGSL